MRRRRSLESIGGQLNAAAALVACSDPRVTAVDVSTGQTDVTFPADFRVLSVTATPQTTNTAIAVLNFPAGSQTYRIYTQSPPGTNLDAACYFHADGLQV